MKKRNKDEIHAMSVSELTKHAADVRKQIKEVELTLQTKEVKNRRQAKELRRKLAVTLSVLRGKVLAERK